jgi:hypothetical protein
MAISALSAGVQGLTGIASGIIGGGARRRELRASQSEFDRRMADYQNLDTSNLYSNLENTYEDLTVNQQQADYTRRQQERGFAATMQGLQGAAGGSGIAALAQSLGGQQVEAAERAAVSIGKQESQNQMLAAGQDASNQMAEIKGEETARGLKREQAETLLGMSQQRLGAANEARRQATGAILGGVGNLTGGFSGYMDKTGAAQAAQMGVPQDPSQIGLFGV